MDLENRKRIIMDVLKKLTPEKLAANDEQRASIDRKLITGEKLTPEEFWFVGDQYTLDALRDFDGAEDAYFRKLYIPFKEGADLFDVPLTAIQQEDFKTLVDDWGRLLERHYPPDSLMAAAKIETVNQDLKQFHKKWEGVDDSSRLDQKSEELFRLLAWSRYRYVLARRIFDLDIKGSGYQFVVTGNRIMIDYESVLHILTRHFAHGEKVYQSKKDHFYGVFAYNSLHTELESILKRIEPFLGEHDDLREVTFRFKQKLYRLYLRQLPSTEDYRIVTFFPVSSEEIIKDLELRYTEARVDADLSFFSVSA